MRTLNKFSLQANRSLTNPGTSALEISGYGSVAIAMPHTPHAQSTTAQMLLCLSVTGYLIKVEGVESLAGCVVSNRK